MKKEVIMLACFLLFITACTDGSGGGSSQQGWRSGTQGIVMSLVQNNPPSEVLSRSDLTVILQYANKGASNTRPSFYLTGFDSNILPFSSRPVTPGLIEGKNQFNTAGSQEDFIKWEAGINMNSVKDVDSFKQYLSITACYGYETVASPVVCVDPEKYEYVTPTRCDFSIKDLGSSQGAPIAVSKVQQKSSGDEMFLEIEFTNKGGGTPYISGDCMKLQHDQVDQIRIQEVTMSGRRFSCNPTTVRLVNGKGFAICSIGLNNKASYYETPLIIRASYNYRDTLPRKEITIVNVDKK